MTPTTTEILTEHFGFVPIEFVDDVINAVNEILYESMKGLKTFLVAQNLDDDKMEKALAQIETLYENAVDKHFDKFELYVLKNILALPADANVLLPHYKYLYAEDAPRWVKENGAKSEDEAVALEKREELLDIELEQTRHEILAEKYYQYRIRAEIEKSQKRQLMLASLTEKLSDLFSSHNSNNSNTQANSILENTKHLSQLIAHLRQLMATTKRRTAASSNGTGNASFSEILAQVDDRSQFINRAINSYLQRAAAAATKEGEGGELGIKTSTTTNAPSYVECAIDHAAFKNIISSGVCIDKADEAPMLFLNTVTGGH